MRMLLAIAVIFGGSLAFAKPSDARSCNHECVLARSGDPAGNYNGLPDWARAALAQNRR